MKRLVTSETQTLGHVVKLSVCLLLAALVSSPRAQAWVYETPAEFVAEGDFDGNGLLDAVIVDKTTGVYRIAYQSVAGTTAWSESRASGIEGVTSVSLGRVLSTTRDTLVVTGPTANRINLLEAPTATTPALPTAVYIPTIGPNLAAAHDIGGAGNTAHADLYAASRENPGSRETLLRNTGAARSVISETALTLTRQSANSFQLKNGTTARLGLFNRATSPTGDTFVALDLSAGTSVTTLSQLIPLPNQPRAPEFISARFSLTEALAQMLFFTPGLSNLLKYQVLEPVANTFTLGGSNSFAFGSAIHQAQILTTSTGPRLLVLTGNSSNATVATVYTFDGTNAPVAIFSTTNAMGFTAGAALGFGNFALMSSDGSGRSVNFQNWLASGGTYTLGASGALPSANPYAGGANVVMFAGEPFVLSTARPLKSVRAREWSSAAVLSGGTPPTVTVSGEIYVNPSNGLANPAAVSLGTAPAGTTHVLVNQYTNPISIFPRCSAIGDTPADVSIAPPAGPYTEAIKITLTANTAGYTVSYRLTPSASWQVFPASLTLFSNATIQFYARNAANIQTPIKSATYTFSTAAGAIDSDRDGVPDFVEAARGLDPNGGPDSDGDGYSDLEELIRGTNPLNKFNAPTNFPRTDFKQVFDLLTTVRGVNVTGASAVSRSGVEVRAFGLDGKTFVDGVTGLIFLPPAGVTNPPARLRQIQPTAGESLISQSTDQHFDINVAGYTNIGREVIGLVPVPPLVLPDLPPGNLALGASADEAWIAAAANIITNLPRTLLIGDLTWRDTLAAALFEAKVAETLIARGANAGTNLTLFPFRAADAGRAEVSTADLLTLESYAGPIVPAFKLTNAFAHFRNSIRTNNSAALNELRSLANTIYQISAAHNNTNPGVLKLPLDALRSFFKTGTLDAGFLGFYGGGINFASAWAGYSNLIATVPPRPTTNLIIEVMTAGPGITTTFRINGSATPVTLWKSDGTPCPLPATFDVLPGSKLALFGYNDISPGLPGFAVEAISVGFQSIPVASDPDANGNLLIDSWECVFFGGEVVDPFGDADSDGYSNLQEMFAGTDPYNPSNLPGVPVVNFGQPIVDLKILPGQTSLNFSWPAAFIGLFKFGVRASESVDGAFNEVPVGEPLNLGGDNFSLNFSLPAVQSQFYYVTVALKP